MKIISLSKAVIFLILLSFFIENATTKDLKIEDTSSKQ